ncbi:hypothetical protein EGJ55_13390 [Pseudomonas moraviensis]|nr:hypothetical protein EGJ55_13390 [Pseudomonas moraviensis]
MYTSRRIAMGAYANHHTNNSQSDFFSLHKPLWERACSRKRRVSQHCWRLIQRVREQARSHILMLCQGSRPMRKNSPPLHTPNQR